MLIEYKKVNVYQEDKLILKEADFQASEGEFIYVIGVVGSGKSSLLKTMYAELDIDKDDAETARVLGRNMTKIRSREVSALRKEIGIIFQDFQLLHDRTVEKNLDFVLKATGWKHKDERNERIDKVLELVGLPQKKKSMPHELSGGEQQRIAIARALLNEPKLIIADEPTGNLDPDTATLIVKTLKDITKTGTCVIMSTHNWSMLEQYPGVIYKCEDGKLIENPDIATIYAAIPGAPIVLERVREENEDDVAKLKATKEKLEKQAEEKKEEKKEKDESTVVMNDKK